jgi:plastocyanin
MNALPTCALRILLVVAVSLPASAGTLQVQVSDTSGTGVGDAVVTLTPVGGGRLSAPMADQAIGQKNKEFTPRVTVVPVGTKISFPNTDTVQHHVYSFSSIKKFDIPLYKDKAPEPVVFDRPGVVVLGCNIHDWMKAYVYVTDTQFFGKSGPDGRVDLPNVPAGSYSVGFWHPRLKRVAGEPLPTSLSVGAGETRSLKVAVELKRESGFGRGPSLEGSGYR